MNCQRTPVASMRHEKQTDRNETMTANPIQICVVIAAMNARDTIARAVSSALAQANVGEVIVVDDASRDSTARAAMDADDGSGRLIVMRLAHNEGPAAARNQALTRSRLPYFCVLDADDFMLPGRMERLLRLGGDPSGEMGWDILADDIVIVPQELEAAGFALESEGQAVDDRAVLNVDIETFVTRNISRAGAPRAELGFVKPIISRRFLDARHLRYDERLRLGEDYALYLAALRAGARFKIVPACGYVAIERSDSLSSTHKAADLERLAELDRRHLAAPAGLTAAEKKALSAHARAMKAKFDYAAALEARKSKGLAAGLIRAASAPSAWRYIVAETLRAKFPGNATKTYPAGGNPPQRRSRLLIGLGNVEVAPGAGSPNQPSVSTLLSAQEG